MSDQATAAFKAAWAGKDQREAATLVKIELARPSARTLYLSGREEIATPGAPPQVWEGGLIVDGEPIISPGSLGESTWAPSTASFVLVNDAFNYQTGSARVAHAFAEYGWIGAPVTFYLWEKSLTDFADALPFRGFVVQDVELERWLVTVRVIKRFNWNREADVQPVTRKRYPRAVEGVVGQFIPKVRGAVREVGMRPPWTAEYDGTGAADSNQHGHAHLVGGRRSTPGVVVDAGGGGDSPGTPTRVVFASHWCRSFFVAERGCNPYIEIDDKLAIFDPDLLDTFNDNTDGCGLTINDLPSGGTDPYALAFFPLPCIQIEQAASNNAENPRAALDIANDTSYARLDYDANFRHLYARLPTIPPLGQLITTSWCLLYSSVGSMANVVFRIHNTALGGTAAHPGLSTTATPLFASTTNNPTYTHWQFGDIRLEVEFTGAASGVSLKIYGIGAIVKFKPNREITGSTEIDIKRTVKQRVYVPALERSIIMDVEITQKGTVPVFAPLKNRWFTSLEGYIDAAAGTYTGTAAPSVAICECNSGGANPERITRASGSFITDGVEKGALLAGTIAARFPADTRVLSVDSATQLTMSKDSTSSTGGGGEQGSFANKLIERPPDLAHHLLVVEGGEASSDITTAGSTFGSFVDARARLKTWRQSDMVQALVLTEPERVSSALERLGRDAGCWFYLSEFDDKWKCIVWKAGTAVDGLEPIGKLNLMAPPRLRPTPGSRRETGVRVLYGYDHFRGHPIHECSIGPGRSNSSHKYRNLRDQLLTVYDSGPEQNDNLDFDGVTAVLDAGEYTGIELAQEVAAEMNSAQPGIECVAGYGPIVVAGFNDTIRYSDGAAQTATIAASAYATMEALATAVAAALNAGSSNDWSCTYSRTTRRFTISKAAGTAQLLWVTGTAAQKRAMILLGYERTNLTGALTYTAEYEREEERMHIGSTAAPFDIQWETGANGVDGTNTSAATLLGYDPARDSINLTSHYSVCPVNAREQTIVDTVAVTDSERPPAIIDGQTIYDHDTARERRDRFSDLMLVDRPEVEFVLVDMPWVERGRVYECASSVDELNVYGVEGSDGSWVGKKFQMLSKAQHIFGSYVTELTAVEIS